MQGAGWIRQHRQAVVLRKRRLLVDFEGTLRLPEILGLFFNGLRRIFGVFGRDGHGREDLGIIAL
jgi:hypothetical protein